MCGLGLSAQLMASYPDFLGPGSGTVLQVWVDYCGDDVAAQLLDRATHGNGLQLPHGSDLSPQPRTRYRYILGLARCLRNCGFPASGGNDWVLRLRVYAHFTPRTRFYHFVAA